jgi:hypothetical protein
MTEREFEHSVTAVINSAATFQTYELFEEAIGALLMRGSSEGLSMAAMDTIMQRVLAVDCCLLEGVNYECW